MSLLICHCILWDRLLLLTFLINRNRVILKKSGQLVSSGYLGLADKDVSPIAQETGRKWEKTLED